MDLEFGIVLFEYRKFNQYGWLGLYGETVPDPVEGWGGIEDVLEGPPADLLIFRFARG